ncbi:MAG: hypothetical protein CMM54_11680 [Rhodospirillaceae bacterium]|nr:hypothetical protein [Rhodospirillaceae bacterium]|tara:strand:+ start:2153 stop:3229 length:1077 start_codon:yes stop_codon:yes gene_type:complete
MKSGLYYGWEGTGGGAADAADIFGQILEQVELGDYLGFDSALIGESHFVEGDLTGSVVDLLGALAGSTRFIRLGSAGKALALQHPANVAEDFAVIDLLSNGRAILGAGIGHSETAFDAFSVPFEERRERFAEALDFIRKAWSSDAFSYGGRFTRFPKKTPVDAVEPFTPEPYEKPFRLQWQRAGLEPKYLAVTPRPLQIPHPPIWVEALEVADTAIAAENGYGILPRPGTSDAEVIALYRSFGEAMAGCGRTLAEVERPVIRDVFCAESRDEAIAIAGAPLLTLYRQLLDANVSLDALLEDRLILGDPDQVFDRFKLLQQETGINHVICRFWAPGIAHDAVMRSLRLYAGEVITRLRS